MVEFKKDTHDCESGSYSSETETLRGSRLKFAKERKKQRERRNNLEKVFLSELTALLKREKFGALIKLSARDNRYFRLLNITKIIRTDLANFNSLCEGQKRTQHRTKRPQHRTKRPFEGQKGQNEAIQDKRAERAPFWLCAFSLGACEISRGVHARRFRSRSVEPACFYGLLIFSYFNRLIVLYYLS